MMTKNSAHSLGQISNEICLLSYGWDQGGSL